MTEGVKKISWTESALGFVLVEGAGLIFSGYLKVWRFIKYQVLRFKDWRIIYGATATGRQIFQFPKARRRHCYIKGLPGSGKSAQVAHQAMQIIAQGGAGIFLDPHGDRNAKPENQGAVVMIFERAQSVKNVVFLSVNQTDLIIGDNPLVLFAKKFKTLGNLKDYLLNVIVFQDTKISLNKDFEVPAMADFILESVIYFHNAYLEWLVMVKGKNAKLAYTIVLTHQITFNDLAYLEHNPKLIDLFIEILGFKASKYYRSDLVARWQAIRQAKKFPKGFAGSVGRFGKIVRTERAKLFFESCGFDLFKERKKGKFVLCDLSGFDDFTLAVLCKLLLVRIFIYQFWGIFWGQTDLFIDEASNIEISNLPHIITQGRKKKLALTLIFHYITQFKDTRIIDAIQKGIITKFNFRNNEADYLLPLEKISDLKDREFIYRDKWERGAKVKTLELPPVRRIVEFEQRGVKEQVLRQRMQAKRIDILAFFKNV